MLLPQDIKHTAGPRLRLDRLDSLAAQFDAAIRRAEATGDWPAIVEQARDDVTNDEIAHMIQQYRDAGWLIGPGSRRDARATIDHPNRSR